MSMQHSGYICENGRTHGKLCGVLAHALAHDLYSINIREFFALFIWSIPADGHNFVVFFNTVDRHRHVIISSDNLEEVVAETLFKKFGVLFEEGEE